MAWRSAGTDRVKREPAASMVSVLKSTFTVLVALLVATGSAGAQVKYVLKGTVVTPDTVIDDGIVVVAGDKIAAVGRGVEVPKDAKVIATGGVILPGFIDLHNHLTWNVFPRFRTYKEFGSRYDWQQLELYHIAMVTPHEELVHEGFACVMNRFAEVKAITQGETSVVGSQHDPCIEGLARNLDFASGFYGADSFGKEKLRYEVFPLQLEAEKLAEILRGLDKQELTSVIVHLAEGNPTNASSAREFSQFVARGLLRPGVSIIHGVALKQADFRRMHENGVGLIWAPRSNFELYGATADVETAQRENVTIALSPDWSPTGSQGMLQELGFANTWSKGKADAVLKKERPFSGKELVRMATEYPAKLAGLSDQMGTLEAGRAADMVVLRESDSDAYDTAVHSNPEDVELVIVNGEAVYGRPAWVKTLLPSETVETLQICGVEKAISFASEARATGKPAKSWKQTTDELSAGLRRWGTSLGPIADCAN